MTASRNNGLVHLGSTRSVSETMNALESVVRGRGLNVLARIDHSGDAAKAGLTMPPAELLIFGNPISGTPLMIAAPTVAIDLPLKALIWQDEHGRVWLTYNSPQYLQDRHGIPDQLLKNIAGIACISEEAVL
jgi:uncharacterized protein (DUF302 family)